MTHHAIPRLWFLGRANGRWHMLADSGNNPNPRSACGRVHPPLSTAFVEIAAPPKYACGDCAAIFQRIHDDVGPVE